MNKIEKSKCYKVSRLKCGSQEAVYHKKKENLNFSSSLKFKEKFEEFGCFN